MSPSYQTVALGGLDITLSLKFNSDDVQVVTVRISTGAKHAPIVQEVVVPCCEKRQFFQSVVAPEETAPQEVQEICPPCLPVKSIDTFFRSDHAAKNPSGDTETTKVISPNRQAKVCRRKGERCRPPSFGEQQQLEDVQALISSYRITDQSCIRNSMMDMLKRWNIPRNRHQCCPWHTAVHHASDTMEWLLMQSCNPIWSPHIGWQCDRCDSLNEKTVDTCEVCFWEQGPEESDTKPSGDETDLDLEVESDDTFGAADLANP